MYNLFLETRAAAQVRMWCELNTKNDQERDALLLAAYTNACKARLHNNHPGGFEGHLFSKCVKEDDHYRIDIDKCFVWADTPEGQGFWSKVHKMIVPIPKRP